MTDVGVVTGLAFEARLIEKAFAREARAAPAFVCSGPGSERAQAAAAKLLAAGTRVLVSFGLCAGLDPALKAGDLMLAEAVIGASGRAIRTDAERRGALAARLSESGHFPRYLVNIQRWQITKVRKENSPIRPVIANVCRNWL